MLARNLVEPVSNTEIESRRPARWRAFIRLLNLIEGLKALADAHGSRVDMDSNLGQIEPWAHNHGYGKYGLPFGCINQIEGVRQVDFDGQPAELLGRNSPRDVIVMVSDGVVDETDTAAWLLSRFVSEDWLWGEPLFGGDGLQDIEFLSSPGAIAVTIILHVSRHALNTAGGEITGLTITVLTANDDTIYADGADRGRVFDTRAETISSTFTIPQHATSDDRIEVSIADVPVAPGTLNRLRVILNPPPSEATSAFQGLHVHQLRVTEQENTG